MWYWQANVLLPRQRLTEQQTLYPFDQPARTMGTRDLELYIPIDSQ